MLKKENARKSPYNHFYYGNVSEIENGKADFDFDKGAVKHKALLPALATTAAQADKDALAAANIKITADNAKATKRAN